MSNNINFINIQYGNVLKQIKQVKLLSGKEIHKVPFTDITKDINSLASIIKKCDFNWFLGLNSLSPTT